MSGFTLRDDLIEDYLDGIQSRYTVVEGDGKPVAFFVGANAEQNAKTLVASSELFKALEDLMNAEPCCAGSCSLKPFDNPGAPCLCQQAFDALNKAGRLT